MSYVAVYPVASPETPNKVLTHVEDIAATLSAQGMRFERWQPAMALEQGATEAQMIAAYKAQIDALGYGAVDVQRVSTDHPQKDELRARYRDERRYAEDHACFFVAGQGLFNLRVGDYVYAVRCEKNDLLVIPAGLAHGFDIGENPHCVTLRLSRTQQGPVPEFTGDTAGAGFPGLDD